MAIIQKKIDKLWRGGGETGTLVHYWWECKNGVAIMERSIKVSQSKNRTTI